MNNFDDSLKELMGEMPEVVRLRAQMSMAIANRIETLMKEKGLSKKQFADALGRRPSEITKWLSGEHNFTIATLARLGTFFGKPVIKVDPLEEKA